MPYTPETSPATSDTGATPLESLDIDSQGPDWSILASEDESEDSIEELPEDKDNDEIERIWAELKQELGGWYDTVTAPQGADEDIDPIAALQDLHMVSQWLSGYDTEIIEVATQVESQDKFIAELGQKIGPRVRQELEQKLA
jgi:hypothetical protein